MHKIKYLMIIVLIILPLTLIISDIYGVFSTGRRKKHIGDTRFKNKEMDSKQMEAEEYLSIWMEWDRMSLNPTINITGTWKLNLEYISPDYEAPVTVIFIIQQNGNKSKGKLFLGRWFESVSFFEGKVFADKFCAVSTAGMEIGYLAALVKADKMDGFIVRKRLDGLMSLHKWSAQKIENNLLQEKDTSFLRGRYFSDLSY